MLYIGIDLGTSAVKLLLMDQSGKVINVVSKEYPLEFPHSGWAQQNPTDWYDRTIEGVKELVSADQKKQVAGISFSGQMHGLVTLDENDQVIRPAILWNDGRSKEETDYLNQEIGKDVLSANTGNIAFAGFTAPKILWMEKNEPELFKRIKKIMLPKDYLLYRFTGTFATDYSDASGTLLLDVKEKNWSKTMLDLCHISEEMLPKLHASFEQVGVLTEEVAKEMELGTNVKVIAGAADNAAAAIGTGTLGASQCNISLGTSGTMFISNDKFCVDENNALHSFVHADGGFHLMGCMLSAASCNKWWMDEIIKTKEYGKEQENINQLGDNDVFFLPYLMGERSPHNDPNVRSMFLGMSMDTTREQMTQAVLEGVAFALKDMQCIASKMGINLSSTKICGGGAKSPLWKKIIANVLNVTVYTLENEEGPAFGAAILAAVGCGAFTSVQEATDAFVKTKDKVEPDENIVKKYEQKYMQYEKLYPAIKDLF